MSAAPTSDTGPEHQTRPAADDLTRPAFYAGLAALLALAALLRLTGLNSTYLWMDESVTWAWSQLPLQTLLFAGIDVHPPLPYLVHHAWAGLFPQPEMARVPEAVAGIATVGLVSLMMADLVSRRAGLVCGLCLAVSTGHVYFSQDARMYVFVVLGLVMALWGLVGRMETRGHLSARAYTLLYVAGGALSVYSQLIGLVALALIGFASLAAGLVREPAGSRPVCARSWVLINLPLGLIALPWLIQIPGLSGAREAFNTDLGLRDGVWMMRNMAGFPGLGPATRLFDLVWYGLVLAGIGLSWRQRTPSLAAALAALALAYPVAILVLHSQSGILTNRVMLPAGLGAGLAAGLALSLVPGARVRAVLVATFTLAGLGSTLYEKAHRNKPEAYRAALAHLAQNDLLGQPMIACLDFTLIPLHIYNPEAPLYLVDADGAVIRYHDHTYWRILARSLRTYQGMSAQQIDAALDGDWWVPGGLDAALQQADTVIVLHPGCHAAGDPIAGRLSQIGFRPDPTHRARDVPGPDSLLEPELTRIDVYRR